jgi:hypothetical protein
MSLPLAARMVLLAGLLAAPVLPPFVSMQDLASPSPPARRGNPALFAGAPAQLRDRPPALAQAERRRRDALISCTERSRGSPDCIAAQ